MSRIEILRIKQKLVREREKRLSEIPKLERCFLRRIEGALGSPDEGLILWELLRDNPELQDQLAALAVRAYRSAHPVDLFSGEDPGEDASWEAEEEYNCQLEKERRQSDDESCAAENNVSSVFDQIFNRDVQC